MTGWWLVSYVVLWGVVIVLAFLLVGVLGHLGLIRRQQEPSKPASEELTRNAKDEGPPIKSRLPSLEVETFNGFGKVTLATSGEKTGTLVIFLSATCESCQQIADPLNNLVEIREHREEVVVFLEADEQICQAFQSLFPLRVPVVCDSDHTFRDLFAIKTTPFAIFYNAQGILVRKGFATDGHYLRALLGDTSVVSELVPGYIFPYPGDVEMALVIHR